MFNLKGICVVSCSCTASPHGDNDADVRILSANSSGSVPCSSLNVTVTSPVHINNRCRWRHGAEPDLYCIGHNHYDNVINISCSELTNRKSDRLQRGENMQLDLGESSGQLLGWFGTQT